MRSLKAALFVALLLALTSYVSMRWTIARSCVAALLLGVGALIATRLVGVVWQTESGLALLQIQAGPVDERDDIGARSGDPPNEADRFEHLDFG